MELLQIYRMNFSITPIRQHAKLRTAICLKGKRESTPYSAK